MDLGLMGPFSRTLKRSWIKVLWTHLKTPKNFMDLSFMDPFKDPEKVMDLGFMDPFKDS